MAASEKPAEAISGAQARRAVVELRQRGWSVGPPAGMDEWRRAVRAAAARAGIRVRTGEAAVIDEPPRPWVATLEAHEAMRSALGGLTLEAFGIALVGAQLDWERTGSRTVLSGEAGTD